VNDTGTTGSGPQAPTELEQQAPEGDGRPHLDRSDENHMFVDPDSLDFDPDEGLYSGTAVEGNSEIPGPHVDAESGELQETEEFTAAKQSSADSDSPPR